ncbi:MAG: hypothetical protein Q8L15_10055 [Methylobacter sp.]|nr:hypothetical protein [Methylobacter sp.]
MEEENDNKIWIITAVVVIALAGTLFMVRSGEHGKYESSAKAIGESKDFSAYKNSPLDKK